MTRSDAVFGLLGGIAAQLALIPLYDLLFVFFDRVDVGAPARSLVAAADTPADVIALVVMTVVFAPIAEEICYRGLLFRGLAELEAHRGRAGLALAVVASSAIFAAAHLQLAQFPGLFFIGVLAALAVHQTGRLGSAVWLHAGFNLTTVVALFVAN